MKKKIWQTDKDVDMNTNLNLETSQKLWNEKLHFFAEGCSLSHTFVIIVKENVSSRLKN